MLVFFQDSAYQKLLKSVRLLKRWTGITFLKKMCLFLCLHLLYSLPSVLWRCWLGGRKGIRPVTEWWDAGVVICLDRGVDLHTAQLMPLPLTVSCYSIIQIGFTFLGLAHLGGPGQRAVKRMCVCYCISGKSWDQTGAEEVGGRGDVACPWRWQFVFWCFCSFLLYYIILLYCYNYLTWQIIKHCFLKMWHPFNISISHWETNRFQYYLKPSVL